MFRHDLTFVPPDRRDEVLRRISVIEDFIARRGSTSAEECASTLGLHRAQFYTLVRAWRETRRPEAIAGAGQPKVRRSSLSVEQMSFMDAVIAEAHATPAPEIVRLIIERASESGMTIGNREIVTRYVSKARPRVLPSDIRTSAALVMDHTVLDLPVTFDGGQAVRPLATLLIDTVEEAVVGLALTEGSPNPAAAAACLLDAVRRSRRSGAYDRSQGMRVVRPVDGGMTRDPLDGVLDRFGISVQKIKQGRHGQGQLAESLLGRRRAGIVLRPRLVLAPTDRRRSRVVDATKWLTPDDAYRLAHRSIVGNRTTSSFSPLDDVKLLRLEDELAVQAGPSWSAPSPDPR